MSKHRSTSDDAPAGAPTGDSGVTYWSVAEGRWPSVRPALPAEMVDLLAPPIVVGVARVVATSRLTPPADPVAVTIPVRAPAPDPVPAAAPAATAAGTGRHRSDE
ncbi:hypothetical protein ACFY2R_27130 [Micromonospora olivasterospora]|uniref:Uncharacterized protein n=1 Tax=Micromonospora olivasterospora TaxID=1880 RepID=A0A562I538_MICOL|nr:hypothetical protein [Micromonospora olivasterospora]TWH66120.1 hypothetical protein JD77_01070 [Micromonospora olivasterospora]